MPLLLWENDTAKDCAGGFRARLPSGTHVFSLQPPTRYNLRWRLHGFLRWKEARTADFADPEAAKSAAEEWVSEWMADLGVVPAPVSTPST